MHDTLTYIAIVLLIAGYFMVYQTQLLVSADAQGSKYVDMQSNGRTVLNAGYLVAAAAIVCYLWCETTCLDSIKSMVGASTTSTKYYYF